MSFIDPIGMSMIRDMERHERTFWEHNPIYTNRINSISDRFNSLGRVVSGSDAQIVIKSIQEEMLTLMSEHMSDMHALQWITLIRSAMNKFLGTFMQGKRGPRMTPRDRLGVLAILHAAAWDFGARYDYFARHSHSSAAFRRRGESPFQELGGIPDQQIRSLRDLLQLAVAFYWYEKAFRCTGRGVRVMIGPRGDLLQIVPGPISIGFVYYDDRVAEQAEKAHWTVGAGIGGSALPIRNRDDVIWVMSRVPGSAAKEALVALRQHFPEEVNLYGFAPLPVDASELFVAMRDMPTGISERTGGISPSAVSGCLLALSDLLCGHFQLPEGRLWLGYYGLLPLAAHTFQQRFRFHLKERLPEASGEEIVEISSVFVRTFERRARAGATHYESSYVPRYMTQKNSLLVGDETGLIIVDYLMLMESIDSWLLEIRIDARTKKDTPKGIVFEKWLHREVSSLQDAVQKFDRHWIKQGIKVSTSKKKNHTDIDLLVPLPPYLLVIACKAYEMRDEHLRGEAKSVENRWNTLSSDLSDWGEAMRELFAEADWRKRNPEVSRSAEGCTRAVPMLLTPRTEWMPVLERDLLLSPGDFSSRNVEQYPIARIASFCDLKRLIQRGGVVPPSGVNYLIPLT